ncbi:biotin/lipoyl-containing protein, partial [Halorhodospira neutriphila]|nr:dihydrolipoamide dehydrogenase [Halorhodospira neutriphila]
MAEQEVKVPDIGGFEDVEVIEVLVSPGERIEPEQSLITLESDKASMEVPSSVAGTVRELRVGVGDTVSEGSVILTAEAEAGGAEGAGTEPGGAAPAEEGPAPA